MNFGEFKHLDLPDYCEMEDVIMFLLKKGIINYDLISRTYVDYLEKQNHIKDTNFEEACACLLQLLNGNFTGKHYDDVVKRAIHTFHKTKKLPPNALDSKYGYSENDEKEWSENNIAHYGHDEK